MSRMKSRTSHSLIGKVLCPPKIIGQSLSTRLQLRVSRCQFPKLVLVLRISVRIVNPKPVVTELLFHLMLFQRSEDAENHVDDHLLFHTISVNGDPRSEESH